MNYLTNFIHEIFSHTFALFANLTDYIQTVLFHIFQVDSAADYLFQSSAVRGSIQYPAPFGRDATPEEAKIAELDAKTGASLKV